MLHARSDYHLARRLLHVACGIAPVLGYRTPAHRAGVLLAIGFGVAGLAAAEAARFWSPAFNRWALRTFAPLLRQEERREVHAAFYYVLALGTVVAFFPRRIALLSILFLAFADPVASLSGITWKRALEIRSPGKTWTGTASAWLACVGVGWLFFQVDGVGLPTGTQALIVATGAWAASLSERYPFGVDDNLSIPLASAAVLWTLTSALSIAL